MLSTANITMQFGAKPLFENVSVKFGDGHRYGLAAAVRADQAIAVAVTEFYGNIFK